jgi:hypothetical protein
VQQDLTWTETHLQGWRFTIFMGSILALVVFLFNLIGTMVIGTKSTASVDKGRILFDGNCEKVRTLGIFVHLIINVMGTILLSASNFAMQCLSAPTRDEVDMQHAVRKWMDIGVLSVRNIRRIGKRRAIMWAVLGISSLPLHLL